MESNMRGVAVVLLVALQFLALAVRRRQPVARWALWWGWGRTPAGLSWPHCASTRPSASAAPIGKAEGRLRGGSGQSGVCGPEKDPRIRTSLKRTPLTVGSGSTAPVAGKFVDDLSLRGPLAHWPPEIGRQTLDFAREQFGDCKSPIRVGFRIGDCFFRLPPELQPLLSSSRLNRLQLVGSMKAGDGRSTRALTHGAEAGTARKTAICVEIRSMDALT